MISPNWPAAQTEISLEQRENFARDGFLALENVLSESEVQNAKNALREVVETLQKSHKTLKNGYGQVWAAPDSPLKIQFQKGHEPSGENDPQLHDKVRKFHDFAGCEGFLRFLALEHPKIQGILGGLIGQNPILSQDMALVNPPGIGTGKPWHQDDAYFKIAPLEAVCGVWIALDDAEIENGCMHFLPGWHKRGALRHFHGSDCEIWPERLREIESQIVPTPLKSGGAVFFSGVAPHMTKPNSSEKRRRALQFHYRARDSRFVSDEEYDAIFVESDGSPASCSAAARRGF